MNVQSPILKVIYNGKDITADLSSGLLSVTYEDKSEGESDEVTLTLEDSEHVWKGSWYPTKGDTLEVTIGLGVNVVKCGTFEIDDIELSGPPDTVTIRGLAAGIKKALRTKKSKGYDEQTLKQIAEKVASENGLTVEGNIPDIRFTRVTQHRETDLGFLKRIGYEYGVLFSVRGKKLTFTTMYEVEKSKSVLEISRNDLASFSLRDKTSDTFKKAKVRYHNPADNKVVENEQSSADLEYENATAEDTLEIRSKAETPQQAEAKAKAALYRANSRQQEGRISVEGNPILLAGNAIELTGLGVLSGKYTILSSSHRIDRGSGYTTDCEVKKIASVPQEKQAPKPVKAQPKPQVATGGETSSVSFPSAMFPLQQVPNNI